MVSVFDRKKDTKKSKLNMSEYCFVSFVYHTSIVFSQVFIFRGSRKECNQKDINALTTFSQNSICI